MTVHRTHLDVVRHLFRVCGFLMLLLAGVQLRAAEPTGFVDRVFRDAAGEHKYVVFVPAGYTPDKKWPVILNLHGAGERGNDGRLQLSIGFAPLIRNREATFPFIVVFPQAGNDHFGPIRTTWAPNSDDGKRALAILDEVEKHYRIDPSRRILTGWSMGGYGAWRIAEAFPEKFSAVVPVSGAGEPSWGAKLAGTRIWAFHGGIDEVVRVSGSREIIAAIRGAGGSPRYTEYSDVAHDAWKYAYNDETLYRWMLDPAATMPPDGIVAARAPGAPAPPELSEEPFHPAVEVPRAVYVRLGNDMLASLARSVPHVVPRELLIGRVNDIHDSTQAAGRTFHVSLKNISYGGEIARAFVKSRAKDRVSIQLGLQNVVLQICAAEVEGKFRTVSTGPMYVCIGHRAPVWLKIDVTPYVENRILKLRLAGVSFSIPDDNWYVTKPAGVSNAGLIMSAKRVSNGLVEGITSKKQTIEQQVIDVVPSLLPQLQDRLRITEINDVVNGFWPLPVYQPRVRAWPEIVSTDENGISLLMGVTAAAIDPKNAPRQARVVDPLGPEIGTFAKRGELQLGVAPNLLNPLTELLVTADVARVHVLDIPGDTFAAFVDRKELAEAIPDLNRLGDAAEISSEMILLAPLSIVDGAGASNSKSGELLFRAPKVGIRVAVRANVNSPWRPYADFEFDVSQPAEVRLTKPTFETRAVGIRWSGTPGVLATAKFVEGVKPDNDTIDVERIRALFINCWTAWTRTSRASENSVPDVDFGYAKLRLDRAEWLPPFLLATFDNPRVKLSNLSEVLLEYEMKGPYSGWGGPYLLKPGNSAEFDVDVPLSFRRQREGITEEFTLPAGSHSEFRPPAGGGSPQLLKARPRSPE